MALDWKGGMYGSALGDFLGAGLNWWGGSQMQNPANAGMPYLNQISQYFQPYWNAGNQALGALQGQYGQLLNNPGAVMNRMGQGFQQSPGYQFQVNQALGAANRAGAAGGMAGSPMEQQNIAGTVNQMANQDYYNYLNHVTGLYGQGLQGEQGIAGMGLNAGEDLAQALMSQAQMAYSGMANQNQMTGGMFGGIGSMLGAGLGALGLGGFL